MEEDESMITQMLPQDFDVNQSKIVHHLKKIGKVWQFSGWILHELSDNSKAERVKEIPKDVHSKKAM